MGAGVGKSKKEKSESKEVEIEEKKVQIKRMIRVIGAFEVSQKQKNKNEEAKTEVIKTPEQIEQEEREEEDRMAKKIQVQFRRHRSQQKLNVSKSDTSPLLISKSGTSPLLNKASASRASPVQTVDEKPFQYKSEDLKFRHDDRQQRSKAWTETRVEHMKEEDYVAHLNKELHENFDSFQSEIDQVKWKAEKQLEISAVGSNYSPPRVIFISSNLQNSGELVETTRIEGTLVIHYDFESATYGSLINEMRTMLNDYREGCKAASVLFCCKGGPGHLYIFKGTVITSAKITKPEYKSNADFWKELGKLMSKINPSKSFIHFIGCNLLGTKAGDELLLKLTKAVRPNLANFDAPLELSPKGRDMIELYFDPILYSEWKERTFPPKRK